ncbi:MAG: response regulator transcription factor [Dehalococcoidia bacterium]|nr:response regulator transcription factor [Dehalococcoidia bacterium]
MKVYRVVLVSPLSGVRGGLRARLEGERDCLVVGEADRLDLRAEPPGGPLVDAVVVDGLRPEELGAGRERRPALVILGPLPSDARLPAMLSGRAWAYLPRDVSGSELLAAVRAVCAGLVVIDPRVGARLLVTPASSDGAPGGIGGEELTARERQVLQLVALGFANKEIAAQLAISDHTVKFHVAAILGKLGAASRTEAIHLSVRSGLVAL